MRAHGSGVDTLMTKAEALALGKSDGAAAMDDFMRLGGRVTIQAILQLGCVGWDGWERDPVNVGPHTFAGVPPERRVDYYRGYECGARQRAEEIASSRYGAKKTKKKSPSKLEQIREILPRDWSVETYSPGDGQTRYRFFYKAPAKQDYFGPASGQYTALGFKEAQAYASGLHR